MNFNYFLPVNLVFGRGKLEELGNISKKYGKKAMVVTGMNSTKKSGLLDRTVKILNNSRIETIIFDEVMPNPLTKTAIMGARIAKQENCDMIIGLGGGSIMDCTKAIAFLCVNDGDISEYIFNTRTSDLALPVILVPTTCGTGSEGNGFAVLTNPENGDKKSLRCNAIVAKASIIDSELMETMPKSVLASVGFDALCHNIEAYLSKIGNPFTEMQSMYAMELIGKNLVSVYEGNQDASAWDAISLASTLGGMVIHSAGVTLAHGMEHPASGLRNIVHGKGLAALTPAIMEATAPNCLEKFATISRYLGGKNESDCVDKIKELLRQLDLNTTLSEQGVLETDVDWMVENCLKVSAAGIQNHPVFFEKEKIKELYLEAL